jgi:FkbH-like protein
VSESAADILAWVDEKPSLSRYVSAVRRLDALPDDIPARSVVLVRNYTVEPMEPFTSVAGYRAGLRLQFAYSGYDPSADEVGKLVTTHRADVVVLALRVEDLAPGLMTDFLGLPAGAAAALAEEAVEQSLALARAARGAGRASVLVHNFVLPHRIAAGLADAQDPAGQTQLVRRMNLRLTEGVRPLDGAHIMDVETVLARVGLDQCYDDRGDRASAAPLAQGALRALAESHVRHLRALAGPAAKCVIVDCDNTLWGGVIGEDGISGISLGPTGAGRRHRDLQQSLVDLRRRGIVLAVCSKNEEADVLEVFRKHPDCILGEADFSAMRINWEDKATNIDAIAKELNLGLGQVVFIDDNPVECAWVRERLPGLRVIEWPRDVPGAIDDLALFDSLVVTDEDRSRTEMYQAEASRVADRRQASTLEEHLRSLGTVATIGTARPEHLARLAQLTQRTNQFNLTLRRAEVADLQGVLADPDAALVWLDLRDRFGGHGIVGCGIVRRSGEEATIDTLLLSCRVLGRQAERVLVAHLADLARAMGASTLIGEFVPGPRNAPAAELYAGLGFDGLGFDGLGFDGLGFDGPEEGPSRWRWRWPLDAGNPSTPDWIEVTVAEESER